MIYSEYSGIPNWYPGYGEFYIIDVNKKGHPKSGGLFVGGVTVIKISCCCSIDLIIDRYYSAMTRTRLARHIQDINYCHIQESRRSDYEFLIHLTHGE